MEKVEAQVTVAQSSGGSGTAAGVGFEARIAAWVAAHILAEKPIAEWAVGNYRPRFLQAQTGQPIDDLLVGYSLDATPEALRHTFVQAKHSLNLETGRDSDLASFLDECVRQYLAIKEGAADPRPWMRPLDANLDRFLLAVGPKSSAAIRNSLAEVLERVRALLATQTLADAAANADQRSALRVAVDHVTRAWAKAKNAPIPDDELRQVLKLVRVHTIDVDAGGKDESNVTTLLGYAVVQATADANAAWEKLVNQGIEWSGKRGSADLPLLQQLLGRAGIPLKIPESIAADARKISDYSRTALNSLDRFGSFEVLGKPVTMKRDCEGTLDALAADGSFLVLGEPGAGKSGVLAGLAHRLQRSGDVVVLRADDMPADGPGGLRAELGLNVSFLSTLQRWPGARPAFLIVDALDAARTERSSGALLDLIEQVQRAVNGVGSRWRVIASIREYDLRHGHRLRPLFRGQPGSSFAHSEFKDVRHVYVPALTNSELKQMREQSPDLAALYDSMGVKTQELLQNAFNLALAADILESGAAAETIREIRTRVELLNRYWERRVTRDKDGAGREALLRDAVEHMLAEGKLRVRIADLQKGPHASLLHDLRSTKLLVDAPLGQVLAFPHHILFDAAVEHLVLRGEPGDLADRLEKDPGLVLTIRPSLDMHFNHLWGLGSPERKAFWATALAVAAREKTPELGKLVGPTVAAELFEDIQDLTPVFRAVKSATKEEGSAPTLLRNLVSAGLASNRPARLTGPQARPWCALLKQMGLLLPDVADQAARTLVGALLDLLRAVNTKPEWVATQLVDAGVAARATFKAMWEGQFDRQFIGHAAIAVCKTYGSDPPASGALLRRCLTKAAIRELGYVVLPWIAREIEPVFENDAAFVESLYVAVFTYEEERKDPTVMSSSVVMALTSNVAQDYDSARYSLSSIFGDFLRIAPLPALRSLIAAVDFHVAKQELKDPPTRLFEFQGQKTGLRLDLSSVWDRSDGPRGYDALPMLDDFEEYLVEQSSSSADASRRRDVVSLLASEARSAVWWRRLLRAGTTCPQTLGAELQPLLSTPEILTSYDTVYDAGELLKVLYPHISSEERARIEQAILGLPEDGGDISVEKARDRLLGCLPGNLIATENARSKRAELEKTSLGIPSNEPMVRHSRATWGRAYSEDDWLRDQKISLDTDETKRLKSLWVPVRDFIKKCESGQPPKELEGIEDLLKPLGSALPLGAGKDDPLSRLGWEIMLEACERVASFEHLSTQAPLVQFVRKWLLLGSAMPWPETPVEESDDSTFVTVGARFYAAGGLMALLPDLGASDREVLGRVEALASDPVRSVRARVAENIHRLWTLAPDRAWAVAERLTADEQGAIVLAGLLEGLGPMVRQRPALAASMVRAIFERWRSPKHPDRVLEACASLACYLWLELDQAEGQAVVEAVVSNPGTARDAAHQLILSFREVLTAGPVAPKDGRHERWRAAAFSLLRRVLAASLEELTKAAKELGANPEEGLKDSLRKHAQSLARLIDTIGFEIYFGSGTYAATKEDSRTTAPKADVRMLPEVKRRFFQEATPLIRELGQALLPSVTHHVLQTLDFLADTDPKGVFLLFAEVVQTAAPSGYQNDGAAVSAVVEFLERYLADYRSLLTEPGECRKALLEILDLFVRAGWPEALRLAQRIAEELR